MGDFKPLLVDCMTEIHLLCESISDTLKTLK